MKSDIELMVTVMRTYRSNASKFERMRVERIRKSDILRDGPILQGAFESAKFLKYQKPMSGLVELRSLLTKMGK